MIAALSPEQIQRLLNQRSYNEKREDFFRKFDPAAEFLLTDTHWTNLFELHATDRWWLTCKGCRHSIKRTAAEEHYLKHKRDYEEFNK